EPDGQLRSLGGQLAGVRDDRDAALDGVADGLEHDIQAVAFGSNLRARVPIDCRADSGAVTREELDRGDGAVRLDECGVVAKVGEEETSCDGSAATAGGRRAVRPFLHWTISHRWHHAVADSCPQGFGSAGWPPDT